MIFICNRKRRQCRLFFYFYKGGYIPLTYMIARAIIIIGCKTKRTTLTAATHFLYRMK